MLVGKSITKKYKVLINSEKLEEKLNIQIEQGSSNRGEPIRVRAQAGAKYQLQEIGKFANLAPDFVKVKRVGKDLHIIFEDGQTLIIQDYYEVMPVGYNGVIGQAENGSFHEYIPEDPDTRGLIPELTDGKPAVQVALGSGEMQSTGAALAVLAFNPLIAGLGVAGVAAGALAGGGGSTSSTVTALTTTGALVASSDSGNVGDGITKINTPELTGKATPGASVKVTINHVDYTTTADASGNYTIRVTNPLSDGNYTPVVIVTSGGGTTTTTNGTPITIDSSTNVKINAAGRGGTLNSIAGTAEAGDVVTLKDVNGVLIGTAVVDANGNWRVTPTITVTAGSITATAVDKAGNSATATGSNMVLINNSAGVNIIAITDDSGASSTDFITNDKSLTYSGTVTGFTANGDKVKLELLSSDGSTVLETAFVDVTGASSTTPGAGTWSWTRMSEHADGQYTLRATLVDTSGNRTNASAPINGTGGGQDTQVVIVDTDGGKTQPDGAVNPNKTAMIDITAITDDSGASSTDFITNDKSLTYSGTVTGFTANGDKVKVELLAADGSTVIATAYVDVTVTTGTKGTWTWPYETTQLSGTYSVRATLVDTSGNRVNAAPGGQDLQALTIDTTGPAPIVSPEDPLNPPAGKSSLSVDDITADNTLNETELSGNVTITGTVRGDFTAGDVVILGINDHTYSGTVNASGVYSVSVAGFDLGPDSDAKIAASVVVHDKSGNPGTISTLKAYNIEAPVYTTVHIDAISQDSGVSNSDFVTNDNNGLTITATLSQVLSAGQKLSYSRDNGVTWTDITTSVSNTAVSYADASLTSTHTVQMRVESAGGNYGSAASQLVTIDATAPAFSSSSTATAVDENIAALTTVYTAEAIDARAIRYSLKTGTGDAASFSIDPATGIVKLTGAPNYEVKSNYSFTVVATDAAGNASEQVVTLAIHNVNEAPVNTLPGAQTATEDTNAIISGLSISDVDAGTNPVTVTLAVTHGTLTIDAASSGVTIGTNNSASITLTGSVSQINALLAGSTGVSYVPTANFYGQSVLTMTTNDGGNTGLGNALNDQDTVAITVSAVNDQPANVALSFTGLEDNGGVNLAIAPAPTGAMGTLVSGLSDILAPSNDVDNTNLGIAITSGLSTSANGKLWYSTDNGTTWTDLSTLTGANALSNSHALVLNSSARLYFQGNANVFGSVATANMRLWDGSDSAASGSFADVNAVSGASGAYSAANSTLTFNLSAINDEPALIATTADVRSNVGLNLSVFSATSTDLGNAAESTQQFKTLTLTVVGLIDGVDEKLTVDGSNIPLVTGDITTATANGWTAEVTRINGTATVTLSHSTGASVIDLNTLVDGIRYNNSKAAITDGDRIITLTSLQDKAGTENGGDDTVALNFSSTITLDTTASTTTATITAINDDTGTITGVVANDGRTDDTRPDVTGTLSTALVTGEVVQVFDGTTLLGTATVIGSAWTFTDTRNLIDAQKVIYTTVVFDGTNKGTASNAYSATVDLTPPTVVSDTAIAKEQGGANNATTGINPSGDVLLNDTAGGNDSLSVKDVTGAGSATAVATSGITNILGIYGTLSISTNGSFTYKVDQNNATVQALKASSTGLDEVFTYTAKDQAGLTAAATLTITVNGANDAATITGTATGAVTEDASTTTASGTLTVTDVDTGEAVFQTPASLAGTYGSYTFNASTGAWTYTLDNSKPAVQALTAGEPVTDTLVVKSLDGSATQNIVVTVTGANDAATITGSVTGAITEDASTTTASGTLTVTDVDSGEAVFQTPALLAGTYGSYTFNASTGAWTYTLDNSKPEVQVLTAGQPVTDTLVVKSLDGSATQNIVVTVTGANDAATITGNAVGAVTEDASTTTASGSLSVTDVDSGEAVFQTPASLAGTYGSYTFNASTGAWTYTLDNSKPEVQALTAGQPVTDTLVVKSLDGSATQNIVVTVNGANDAATITGTATGAIIEDASTTTASGSLSVTDVDSGEAVFQTPASLSGTYGSYTFNANTGAWTYTLDSSKPEVQALTAGQPVTDTLVVKSLDGSATQNIVVTVTGANDAATITGNAVGAVTEDASTTTASGSLSVTDVDSGEAVFQTPASLAGTYGSYTFNASTGAWTYTLDNSKPEVQALTAGEPVTDTLVVKSLDGSATQNIVVTVTGANDAATITGTATGAVTEGASTTTASGSLSVTDVDSGEAVFQTPASLSGTYGSYTFNASTGAWTYTLDNSKPEVQALTAGQPVTDTLVVKSLDGSATQNIVVTITGANDVATITGTATGAVTEDASTTTASGSLSVTDVDSGEAVFQTPASLAGTCGSYTFNASTGAWTYTLDSSKPEVQALTAGQPVTDTLVVKSLDGSATQNIVVTVTGANDAATITGNAVGAVTEDASTTTASGSLSVTDVDSGEAVFQTPASLSGTYGSYTFNASTGAWTYTLDNSKPEVQALTAGQPVTDTLVVKSLDGSATQNIVVTITGANDVATITGTATGAVTEDASTTTASGSLSVTDVDSGEAVFQTPASLAGTYGSYTFNASTGAWTYTLDSSKPEVQALTAGQPVTDTLVVKSLDGSATQNIVVTVTGANDAATITGNAVGAVTEDASTTTASGTLTVTDVDSGEAVFQTPASLVGTYGSYTFNASTGAWTYTLDSSKPEVQALTAGQPVTDTLVVKSLDGSATQNIVVTITGANDVATITGTATGAVTEDASTTTASGSLSVTDVDSGEAVFQTPASLAGTYGSYTFNASTGAWTYTLDSSKPEVQALTAGQPVTDTLVVKSLDGSATQNIVVTVTGANDAATITGNAVGAVTEDASTNTASGTLTVTDVDSGEAVFQTPASLAGTYGSYTFNASTGAWTYTLDNSKPAVQALNLGQPVTDTLVVKSLDGSATQNIVVTVTGANDAATIIGTATGAVTEDASTTTASGTLTVTDVDSGEAVFQTPTSLAGTYGSYTFNASTGAWTYTVDNSKPAVQALNLGQPVTDTLVVKSLDGSATQNIVVTVTGANDAATITGNAVGAVTEDASTTTASGTLTVTVTDVDSGEAVFQTPASLSGTYGSYTFNASTGAWTYTLDNSKPEVQALTAGQPVTDTLVVKSLDGSATQNIVVTVTGANDAATITGNAVGAVTEDASTTTASGTLTVTDVDSGEAVFQTPASLNGTYGSYTFNASTGAWTYTLDNSKPAVQALNLGQPVTDTLVVKSSDGSATQNIVVTITGANDAATITGTATGAIIEDASTTTASGTLTVTDVDSGEAVFQKPASLSGTYGSYTFNASTGAWTYTLDNSKPAVQALNLGQPVTDTLVVKSSDGSDTQNIVVTITGANDAATITGTATGAIIEDASTTTASGTLTVTDVDSGEAVFQTPASLSGTYGSYTFNASTGAWTYTLDNSKPAVQALNLGQPVTDTLVVKSLDGSATQNIVVTVTGANDAATITGNAVGAVTEDASTTTASGTLTVTDVDTGEAVFQTPASLAGTYGSYTFNASTGAWTYTLDNSKPEVQALTAGQPVTDTLVVKSLDGSATQNIVVTVNGANDAATITGNAVGAVTEDASTTTASGSLSVTDVDSGEAVFQTPASLSGTYGSYTFNASTGAWTYTLDNSKPEVQALTAGQPVTDTLVVKSLDGSATQNIVVTITGANDAATITGNAVGAVTEDASTTTASGSLSVTDVDSGEAVFQTPALLAGTYGSYTFNASTGAWTYTLDNSKPEVQALTAGEPVTDTLVVKSLDGSATQNIVVTITGANDAATITGTATGAIIEDASTNTASGTLTVIDVDSGEAVFQTPASLAGTYGSYTFNASTGAWTYTLDNSKPEVQALTAGQPVTDTLVVKSLDGSATQNIVVTVTGANDAATITGTATGAVTEDASTTTASGTLTVTDVDSGEAVFQTPASLAGTYGSYTFNASTGAWTYTVDNSKPAVQALNLGQPVTDTLVVKSLDGSATQNIVVTVTGANDAATFSGDISQPISETEAAQTVTGQLNVADIDSATTVIAQINVAGSAGLGKFSITASGAWTYVMDNAQNQLKPSDVITDSLTVSTADGTTQVISVVITGTNDAPVLTTGSVLSYTEAQAATAINTLITVADADNTTQTSAKVAITGGFVSTEDVLSFVADSATMGNITGSYSAGVMSLSSAGGTATLAQWQAALQAVQYSNTSANPDTSTRTVSYTTNDGTQDSAVVTSTINLVSVNNAPVNTVPGAQSTAEDTAKVITGLSIADSDAGSGNMTVTLAVAHGSVNVAAGTGVTLGSNSSASVTLSGQLADINTLLATSNAVTYTPTAHYNGSDTLTVTTSDKGNTGTGGTQTDQDNVAITVTAVNDAPTGTSSAITVLEDGSRTFAASDFGFADASDSPANVLSAVIITTLPTAGTLKLNGTAVTAGQSIAVADLGNLVYAPAVNGNGAAYATIGFKVQDNGGTANGGADTSAIANTLTINVTPVNDQPSFTSGASLALSGTEDTAYDFVIGTSLVGKVTDPDAGATVKGIAISWNQAEASQGVWSWSSDGSTWTAIPADITGAGANSPGNALYLNATEQLRFTPVANWNGQVSTLLFRVADDSMPTTTSGTRLNVSNYNSATGAMSAGPSSYTLTLAAVNDAPGLIATGVNTNTITNVATTLFSAAASNLGNSMESTQKFKTLVLTVDGLKDGASEKLTVDGTVITLTDGTSTTASANGWTASVSVVDGKATVTLSNSSGASDTALNTLVNGIQYIDSAASVTAGNRVITLTSVQDNGGTANSGTDTTALNLVSTITVVGNAAPVNTVPDTSVTPLAVTEDTAKAITGLSVADDGQGSTSYTVTLTASNGVLNVSGGTATIAGTGTSTVALTGTLAQINATLAATVSYMPTANYNGAAKITMATNDNSTSGALTDSDDINLTVGAVNDIPVVTPGGATSYTEQAAAIPANGTITVSDVDSSNLSGATVTIDPATFKATDLLAFADANGIAGSYNGATGVLTLTGSATVAQYQAALQSVTFNNSSDAPGTTRTLKWTVTDDLNATSTIGSSVINIMPVNDAPLMTDVDGLATNPLGATGTTATTSGALDGHTATQTFGLTTATVTGNLGTVYAGMVFLNDGGGSNESVNMAFSLPVSKITATWQGVNSGDNLQIKINGQFLTLTTAMISGASLSADKLTAIGTSATYTMTINAADVPGGVINSITLVAPGNFGAGGFYSSNFTVTESLYTAAQTVASMFGGVYSDVDPDAMKGVVITSAGQGTDSTTLGTYVYSSDNGVTWNTLASGLTDSTSVFLKNTDQIRFIRSTTNGSSTNKPDLIARLVDTSGVDGTGSLTSGTVVDVSGTKHGGSTAFSDNAITLKDLNLQPASPASVTVTGLEDAAAPVGAVGTSIASLVELSGMDPEGVAVGLAFVAQITNTANTFYYSLNNGATWVAAPTTAYTTSNALILPSTALVYFKGTAANFNGILASTSVRLWDGTDGATAGATKNISTLTGANGAYSATNTTLNLVVTAVNDTPLNTVPAAQTATEDTDKVITGLQITDVDAGTATNMSVTLSVTNGTITMLPGAGTVTLTNNGTSSVTLIGTLANINTLLALANAVKYKGNLNFNGSDTLTMLTSDNGNTGTGGTLTDSDNVTITVSAVNDGPVNTVPGAQSTAEDTQLVISGLQMADVDSTTGMSVTLAVTNGTINVLAGTGVTITTNGTASVKLAGTQADINALLATANAVTYTPTANYSGAALLTMTTSDGTVAVNDVDTVAITVTPVNDAPVLATTSTITYVENAAAAVINSVIVPTDADNTTFASAKVSITAGFEANKDVLSFTNVSMGNIALTSYDATTGVMTLTSAGSTATLAQWQAALRAVKFNSTTDNPVAPRTVSYVLNDGSSDSNAITSTINFTAVNDAPVNTVPAAQSAGVGTVTAITGLSIADTDANSGSMTVTLSLPTGVGVISVSGGSATIASGNGTNSVVLTGTVADINSTLASSVTYTLASSAPASTTLTMLTSDNGNTGGAALTDSDPVTIAVQKIVISNVQVTTTTQAAVTDSLELPYTNTWVTSLTTSKFQITTTGNEEVAVSTANWRGLAGTTALMVHGNSGATTFTVLDGFMSGTFSCLLGSTKYPHTVTFKGADGSTIASTTLPVTGNDVAYSLNGGVWSYVLPTGAQVKSVVIGPGDPSVAATSAFFQFDNLSFTGNVNTTTTINNALTTTTGTSTSVTPTTINGTLAVALGANEVVEVFRNGVSIGNATVTGTTWKIVDSGLSTVQSDLYEARVKNTATSVVVTESNDYAINPGTMTAAISMSDTTLLVGETSTVTFTFSESPLASSFVLGDITAASGTVSNLVQTSDPKVWTALYTPTANLQSVSGNLISLAASSYMGLAGSVGQAASSSAFVVDTKPPVATVSVGNVTMDNVVSSTDSSGMVLVTGSVTGEFVAGDVVTLNVNGTPYSGTVNASGSYSVNVSGSDLAADPDKTIGATLLAHDIYGNTTTVPVTKTYLYSAVMPTITDMVAVKDSYSTLTDNWNSATQIDAYTVKSNLWTISTTSGSLGRPTLTVSPASTAIWGAGAINKFLTVGEMGATSGASSTGNNTGATIKFVPNSGAGTLYSVIFDYVQLMSTASVTYYDENNNVINGITGSTALNANAVNTTSQSYSAFTPYLKYAAYFVLSNFGNETFYLANGSETVYTGTTTPVIEGGSANLSSTIVNGTLSTGLAANEVLEVFRNGVSVGNATVTGTTWSVVDRNASSVLADVYTARVKNTSTSTYLNASNVFSINPAPILEITDNSATDVVASASSVTYSFTFDQAVTGFDINDVTVTNGTKGAFTKIDDSHYTLVVTEPAGNGTTQVVVANASYTALVSGSAGVPGTGSVSLQDYGVVGSAVAKTLTGTTSAETLLGSELADSITGAGGADKIYTGAGDDTVILNAANITSLSTSGSGSLVDGGSGTNIFKLSGTGITLDLTSTTVSANLRNFSSVDLTGSGNNTLKLSLEDVLSLPGAVDNATTTGANESKMLVINGDAGDGVQLVSGSQWTQAGAGLSGTTLGGTATATTAYGAAFNFVAGHTYAQYSYGGATLFVDETMTLVSV